MKIQFAEISTRGSRYELSDCSWFPGQELKQCGDIEAAVILTRKDESKVALQGFLQTTVELTCDRCQATYLYPVDTEMQLVLEFRGSESWQLRELECRIENLDLVEVEKPEVDLGDILRQQLFLSLPHKSLCRTDCRGLCPRCGVDLNKASCRCPEEPKASPFAVLAKLKQ